MNEESGDIIELRQLRIEDYVHLRSSMDKAYEQTGLGAWKEKEISRLLEIFPEGQLCITVNDKMVARALALIINYSDVGDQHTHTQIHGNHSFNTHDPEGDVESQEFVTLLEWDNEGSAHRSVPDHPT